ncbi:CLUMA_CG021234, isoform A [Clunio marinus]|uniref:E2 NEDD8-conjugating enzyme n=1 Tax=Clunio marinus TaxID=568069 RepID=A0A1J1J8R2_9DIPT|nr:CLUMA_CG021234, isoform A [Clunio marinus]
MITLTRKKANESNGQSKRISIRDKLLVKEVQEMEENLPSTVKTSFPDSNNLSEFYLTVQPNEGLWKDGRFKFLITINEDYNMMPPKVKCLTKILHPNISAAGDVCLSLLRLNSIDGMGWMPTRRLKDVIFGINSLFTDLCDFDDPLNIELSEEYAANSEKVKQRIREHVLQNAMR